MTVLTKNPNHRKHAMEELLLLSLRFRCFMSKEHDITKDVTVMSAAHHLLRRIQAYLPSPEFQRRYMDQAGLIGSDNRFSLHINHDMNSVVVRRADNLANVHKFVRVQA